DGAFYYPRLGIGMIAESLGEFCGRENIRTGARITKISHSNDRILNIEINGSENFSINEVVSTVPLTLAVRMMDPPAPLEIIEVARQLRFRNLMLVALFLDRESVGGNATMYFPESQYVFTRVYEPK